MQDRKATAAGAFSSIANIFPTMNLASKISLPFMIVLAVFFIKVQFNYFNLLEGRESLQRDLEHFSTGIQRVSALQNNLAEIKADLYRVSVWSIAGVSRVRLDESVEQIKTVLKSTDTVIKEFEDTGIEEINKVRVLFDEYSDRVSSTLSIMYRNAFAGATATRELDTLHKELAEATAAFTARAENIISERTRFANEETVAAVEQFILISIASLSVLIALTLILYISVARPIRHLVDCIVSLEHSAENVNVPYCNRSDEIGHIARALRSFSAALTERQKLEKKVYEQKEEALRLAAAAKTASAAKSSFLANMSHEIRTPMNSILGMAELLRETKLTKKQYFFAKTIFNSSAALLKIINDVLDFSKIEAGKLHLDPVPFSPAQAVQDVVDLLGPSAQEKSLDVSMDLDPDTPDRVIGDAGRIRQVLTNLIGNAVKFTNKGFVRIALKATYSRNNVILRFEISDSGIGIEKSKLENIFDDFSQAESSTTRNYGGTGLGLSISRNLIEAMGGRIGVISQTGEGATFWFELELPVVAGSDQTTDEYTQDTDNEDLEDEVITPAVEGSHKVLIADDNQLNQVLLKNMLEKDRYELHYAENGEVAARMTREMPFDVILMDISMPVLDGIAATKLIRDYEAENDLKAVPIIALTAHVLPNNQKGYSEAGFSDFLAKPLRKADLLRMIEIYIKGEGISSRISA